MKWIDASDIKNWPNVKQRSCQDTLPELVRRLILAHTANIVEEFDFPSGDSVTTGGWDGRLNTPVISPFFPSGRSGWELGTEKSAKTKAEKDYVKRTSDSLGLPLADTTFVFVTPRSWPERVKWQSSKRSSKKWKNVRVINADNLELWLESTPAVALWLARQIGKVVSTGIRDIEAVWEEWSIGTRPVMSPDLVIGGRLTDVESIKKWTLDKPSILEVQGDHPAEAFAFLYASITTLPQTEKAQALARCVVVETIGELRQLTQAFKNPLIIVATGECIDAAHVAVAKGHHVFISMDATVIGIRNILRLSRPQLNVIEKNLHDGGLSEADAQRIARDSGHSIPVLRRQLFQAGSVSAPAWANAESARTLIPILFANAWDEQKDEDRRLIETLSGTNYDAFVKELIPFLTIDDAPIRKIGSIWMIKSPLDAWFLLAQHLTENQLKLFEQSLLAVLTKTDPKYDLEAEKRWAAAIYGKSNPYSEWLRTGLVESLILLALFGDHSPKITSTQAFADHIVREILTKADKWEAWASIKDATTLLAEAAPNSFMKAVEQGITKQPAIFQQLMKDDPGVFGECKHTGLLWGLEGIAWSSEYFARAVNILAELANMDPGGSWANRAINSLKDIFLLGFPQTYAKPEERLIVIDALIAKYPKMVWKFTQSYYGDGIIGESHRFRWRNTGGTRKGLKPEDNESYQKYAKGLLPKLADLVIVRENIVASTDDFLRLPDNIKDKLLEALKKTDTTAFSKEEQTKLLISVRDDLNWINSYGGSDTRKYVPALSNILEKFTPEDVLERTGWLLSTPWPHLPEGEPKEQGARDILVKQVQEKAAREVLDKVSLDKILEFSEKIEYPGVLGHMIGRIVRNDEEDEAILDILVGYPSKTGLIRGYAYGRIEMASPTWIDKQIKRMKAKGNYLPVICALMYLSLPEGSATWSTVKELGKEVEGEYWKYARGYSQSNRKDDAPIAIEKLLDAKRAEDALHIAGDPAGSIPSTLLQRLIQELLTVEEKRHNAGVMDAYYLGHVFNQLYERNELPIEEIAKLEWPFALLFDDIKRNTSSPMALHRALQKDPHFFSQLITFIYKRDDNKQDATSEDITKEMAERRANVVNKVLDSWHLMPGSKDDGSIDEKELNDWIELARKQCAETKHVLGCDIQIGFMLAHAPADPDGVWPHAAVRKIIEHLNNDTIERHIQTEIYNSRGVVTRGLDEGGRQERELAEKYKKMSDTIKSRWPRTANILHSIAESYAREAKREDIDSDLHELRYD